MVERVFTRDVGKNFKKGEVRDYPASTWQQIAKSAKLKLEAFSKLRTLVEPKDAKKMTEGSGDDAPPPA